VNEPLANAGLQGRQEIHTGRWHSPDPLGRDVMNPQYSNRSAYADNNLTALNDPPGC
jgi:hypothetical protein